MKTIPLPSGQAETHEVLNQPLPLKNYNIFSSDQALQDAVRKSGGEGSTNLLQEYGALAGGELMELGIMANQNRPRFYSHDHYGRRIDLVEYHPAYHRLMEAAISHGIPSLPWAKPGRGAHVTRATLEYMHNQAESGSGCPLTMTFACMPLLKKEPLLARALEDKILAPVYDPRNVPYTEKQGLTIGMAMTEKQGGSDVRANTTQAVFAGDEAGLKVYELVGHKWFCSAPMCDAFFTLANTEKGLSSFFMPRWRPDGSKNQFYIQQLKDKLGNQANALSEVELRGAFAYLVGEEGRGIRNIIEMVAMTRFDCMVGSASVMRQALVQAVHHARYRAAFGRRLVEQSLMQNVLADLVIESEAALYLSLRVARALDAGVTNESEALFHRLAIPVGKYWVCKRATGFVYETMECLGGSGYIETSPMARLFREAPLNSIWEGSGNVQCLDVLRVLRKDPECLDVVFTEIQKSAGQHQNLDHLILQIKQDLSDLENIEYQARRVVDKLALALQATILLEDAPDFIANAFCASRLATECVHNYGCLPLYTPVSQIIERTFL